MTSAGASFFSSNTKRVLPLADSLRISRMPSSSPRLTSSAVFCSICSTEVWYGIAVTTIWSLRAALDDLGVAPELDRAATGPVGVEDALTAHDLAAGREVGALDEVHQVVGGGVGVLDEVEHRVAHLAQVVGRDVGGHADGDALAAVDQQVREPRRQDVGLFVTAVEVGREVDGVLVDVGQQLHGQRRQSTLGVAVRRRGVARGAEVAVGVDEAVADTEVLAEPDQRVVDRRCRRGGGTCRARRRPPWRT